MTPLHRLAPLIALTLLAGTAAAQTTAVPPPSSRPDQLVKWRQSAYQVLAWNNARIKVSLDGTYQREEVLRAAQAIAVLSQANIHSLFTPGTEKARGWKETSARPELFTEPRFHQLGADFTRDAQALAQTAAAGDVAAIRAAFGQLTKSCKACHDAYKARD
ncbi:MAG: cytochrome c [Rubrivivax sp.]|jgi:cytochrome c556|nr:cytochrome c [Rubrivivax sp.]